MKYLQTKKRPCDLFKVMSGSNCFGITLWICILITKGVVVRGQTTGGPNAIALIKGQATLDCVTVTVQLAASSWTHTTDGTNNPLLIAVGCAAVTGNNAEYYRTQLIGANTCRLIIANATMQQAGVYLCNDGLSTTYRSLVTVIDPVASVVVYNQSEVVDADQLNISCSINYNGPSSPAPSLRPSPYWTTSPEQIFTSAIYHPSTNVVTLVATVTVRKPTVTIFQCKTVFSITGNTSGYNATAPADSFTVGNTPELDVQYSPGNINIASSVLPKDECVQKQESLTCTADANPPAQYKWLDLNSNTPSNGSVKYITSGGQYQCTAYNDIRNKIYNQTKTATEANCSAVKENNMTMRCTKDSCNCTGDQPLTITCEVYSVPKPTYRWLYDDQEYSNNQTIPVTYDGNYSCTARNSIGTNFFEATVSTRVYNCTPAPPISKAWIIVPVYVIVCWILGFLCFPMHYNVSKRKDTYNQFPVLMKMLPCLNKASSAEAHGGSVGWIILYIVMVTFVGLFAIPVMFLTVQCSKPNKKGQNAITTESGEIKAEDQPQNDYEDINFSGYQELTPKTMQANSYAQLTDLVPEKTASAESKEKGDSEFSEELADKSVLKQNENANSS